MSEFATPKRQLVLLAATWGKEQHWLDPTILAAAPAFVREMNFHKNDPGVSIQVPLLQDEKYHLRGFLAALHHHYQQPRWLDHEAAYQVAVLQQVCHPC